MSKPPRKTLPKRATATERLHAAIEQHKQGKAAEAAELYRSLLRENPEHPDALHFLGVAEAQLGLPEEALVHVSRALSIVPTHVDVLNNRGNILKKLGRLDDAEKDYRKALAARPDDANILSNLGTVLRHRGHYEEAESMFRRVIGMQPSHAAAWQNLGNTLSAQGRLDEALDAQREAFRLEPQSANAYRHLGAMLFAVGRKAEATEIYGRWLELFPDDPRARHLYAACTGDGVPARASDDCVRAEFERFAADFDANLARLEYKAPKLVEDEVTRRLGEVVPVLDVLDAGCGTGLCAGFLRSRARRLTGVDLSPAMIEQARNRSLYDALVVEELTAYLRRHPSAFDLVASADTLVYFGDLSDVIQACARALRAGGTLVFTVERMSETDGGAGFRLNPHGRYSHTRDYLAAELAGSGFRDAFFQPVDLRKEADAWVEGCLVSATIA